MARGRGDDFTQVSNSGFGAFEAALAPLGDSLAVVWNDNRGGNDEIYLRLLDGDLRPLSAELRLTDDPSQSFEAAVANFGGQLAIAWYDREANGRRVTKLGLWTPQGERLWQHAVSSPDKSARVPVLQVVEDRLFIAWVEEALPNADSQNAATIRGAWFDIDGSVLVPAFDVAEASRTTWNMNVDALPDGRIVLVYDSEHATRASELYLALIGIGRAIVMPLSADDGFASKYPDIAVGARLALTWFDVKDGNAEVYLALFDTLGTDALANAMRMTNSAGESIGAYLAWNGDALGLAWNDDDAGQHEIYFQRFDAAGQGGPLQRLTNTEPHSRIPAIVPHRDGFVLAWNE
ncbi:MAG: hypothetical protein SV422_08870, partial [Pseudomonadota bacterium]|nr:hypothetical protein [Pseudomonadota bacterium]